MSNLNPWQRVDWVLQGAPFGDGLDGDATISADPNTKTTVTGSSSTNNPTLGSGILADGEIGVIIQMQGTGVGQWEWIRVLSGGGTTTPLLTRNLVNSYTTGAQVLRVPRYNIATLSSFNTNAWDGSVHGMAIVLARNSIVGSGTLGFNGGNGTSGANNTAGATGGGFRGGKTSHTNPSQAFAGEGKSAVQTGTSSANSTGGGGGATSGPSGGNGGGGGGNVTGGSSGTGGTGGGTGSSADGITLILGGGGGGGANDGSEGGSPTGSGASGGAILMLISASVDVSGMTLVNLNGGNGGNANAQAGEASAGGGGAGGFCLIMCRVATLGTNKITASGGTGGVNTTSSIKYGGDGGDGGIAIHHSGTVTGSTTPNYTDVSDPTMVEAGAFLALL